jgi:flavin-dependent dehydrogenase
MTTHNPEVVVIGGGPAGATAATVLAQRGRRVTLLERGRFPRFHIGESLIPQTYHVLKRINMLPKLQRSHFIKKYSVQFVTEQGVLSEPFYFTQHRPHESSQTWQVRRDEFDQMMLDNAREQGVDVQEGQRVVEVLLEGQRAVGVRVQGDDGTARTIHCAVVIDASGLSSVMMDRLGLRQWDPDLKKAALWTYWKGAQREVGIDEGATIVLQLKDKKGWFWYIPLHDDVVSVGVVADHDYLFKNRGGKDYEVIYMEEVSRCPGLQPRLANAQRCDTFRVQKEYSYKSKQPAGDGWVLVGDALGFLDPLYSSGVLLALTSGAMAADAVADGLERGDTSMQQLGQWGPEFYRGMDRMRRLVCAFYEGLSFGRFSRKFPHLKGFVTDILIGDIFKDDLDQLWEPIEEVRRECAAEPAIGL